jgi:hypothetical protein
MCAVQEQEGESARARTAVVRSVPSFAEWRGCDIDSFGKLRHLDLVLDEGQFRGHGTFLAVWDSASSGRSISTVSAS